MGAFDPSGLQVMKLSELDLAEMSAGESLVDGRLRERSASARLAAQIVTRAYAASADLGDENVLAGMSEVLKRHALVRQACLRLVAVEEDSEDFGAAVAAASAIALDVIADEFKWRQIGARDKELPVALLSRLIEAVSAGQPALFARASEQLDDAAIRRIAVLQAAPAMLGLVNLFDYYTADRDAMVARLIYAVASQAEFHSGEMDGASGFARTLALKRIYGISTSVMVEVYKGCAYRDVGKLRDLQDLDRSMRIAHYERIGGMDFGHVLAEHERVMSRTLEVCNVIVKAQMGAKEIDDGDRT